MDQCLLSQTVWRILISQSFCSVLLRDTWRTVIVHVNVTWDITRFTLNVKVGITDYHRS